MLVESSDRTFPDSFLCIYSPIRRQLFRERSELLKSLKKELRSLKPP
ncbi:MAG: hypothetical protein KFF72_08100 [Arthrospira sp. SH-MAG29]|nr:hypothetical protein [Arthrospira sp. SH-MAG29]MBS0016311.1 hypothetical protein [Arthrospira sp. SH-MAG29]